MPYSKICIVCMRSFLAKRVSAIYCSDPCRNKGRSFNPELKASLIRRNSSYLMKANNWVAEVPDKHGTVSAIGYVPDKATDQNPLGEDEAYLLALAKMQMQQRKDNELREEIQRRKSMESESGFGSTQVDPEMLAMMHTLKDDELPVLEDKESQQPKKYKIKKFSN